MPIYVLRELENVNQHDFPGGYSGPYTAPHGFVVIAPDEIAARRLACEADDWEGKERWQSPEFTSCEIVTDNGSSFVVLGDYPTG